jgi:hypothetical protein
VEIHRPHSHDRRLAACTGERGALRPEFHATLDDRTAVPGIGRDPTPVKAHHQLVPTSSGVQPRRCRPEADLQPQAYELAEILQPPCVGDRRRYAGNGA